MKLRINAIGALLVSLPGTVGAETVVLESYAGSRAPEADRLIPIVREELQRNGIEPGAGRLRERIAAKLSASGLGSASSLDEASNMVRDGHLQWLEGNLERAADLLDGAASIYRSAPANVAETPSHRDTLFKCLIYLSLSYERLGRHEEAQNEMAELVRGFPDRKLSHREHGPEATTLFTRVKEALATEGYGSLEVTVDDPAVVVFVNERYTGSGATRIPRLLPGTYRVYLQKGDRRGRVHHVFVAPNAKAAYRADWDFDVALTTDQFDGFEFESEKHRSQMEWQYVTKLSRELGATQAVVLGVRMHQGRRSVIGTVVALDGKRPIRSAAIAIETDSIDERLRSLGRFLAGREAAPGVDVVQPRQHALVGTSAPKPPRSGIGPWQIATMSAGAVLLTGGVTLIALHQPRGESASYRPTRPAGISLTAVGAAAAVTGLTWWLLTPADGTPFVFGGPTEDGAVAGVAGRF